MDNKYNLIESILGGLSFGSAYVGAAAASSAFALASSVVFMWSMACSYYGAVTEYDSIEEHAYRFFIDANKARFSTQSLGVGLKGDFELGFNGDNYSKALSLIFNQYADKPKELDAAVARFYNDYASLFWNALTEKERDDFCYREYQGQPIMRHKWKDPSGDKIRIYIDKVLARAASESKSLLRGFATKAIIQMMKDMYRLLHTEVEPYLNQKLTFIVNDKNLEKVDPFDFSGETKDTFDYSKYASHEIYFSDRLTPQFTPLYVSPDVYTPEKYMPKAHKDSNVIYECTMYHYIQMGCPTKIIFAGDGSKELPEVSIKFQVEGPEILMVIDEMETIIPTTYLGFSPESKISLDGLHSSERFSMYIVLWSVEKITLVPLGGNRYKFILPKYDMEKGSYGSEDISRHVEEAVFEGFIDENGDGHFELVSGGNFTFVRKHREIKDTFTVKTSKVKCSISIDPKYKLLDFDVEYEGLKTWSFGREEPEPSEYSFGDRGHVKIILH